MTDADAAAALPDVQADVLAVQANVAAVQADAVEDEVVPVGKTQQITAEKTVSLISEAHVERFFFLFQVVLEVRHFKLTKLKVDRQRKKS